MIRLRLIAFKVLLTVVLFACAMEAASRPSLVAFGQGQRREVPHTPADLGLMAMGVGLALLVLWSIDPE